LKVERERKQSLQETFRSFLHELEDPAHASGSGKELLEAEVLSVMRKEGFSDKQVYDMPLKKLLDIFYDAYLWKANSILSKATIESFLKRLQRILV
jgi:hypothetical protein